MVLMLAVIELMVLVLMLMLRVVMELVRVVRLAVHSLDSEVLLLLCCRLATTCRGLLLRRRRVGVMRVRVRQCLHRLLGRGAIGHRL